MPLDFASGKSTVGLNYHHDGTFSDFPQLMRMTATGVIMAQLGMLVPAASAR